MAVSEKTLATRFAEKNFQAKPFENKAAIIQLTSNKFRGTQSALDGKLGFFICLW
jgi:hypothetical protein